MDELKLLCGLPIILEPNICLITPLTLREITAIGLDEYYSRISLLTISSYDIEKLFEKISLSQEEESEIKDVNPFDFTFENCMISEEYFENFKKAIRMVTGESINLSLARKVFYFGNFEEGRVLDKDNFFDFQNIIRKQNCIEEEKKLSDFEKKMKAKFEKNREKVNLAKKKQGDIGEEQISFETLVSSIAAHGNGINIFNVWDLTMYSFNDQLKRMQMIEEYQDNLNLICAGADSKKIKLKHYIRNIDE